MLSIDHISSGTATAAVNLTFSHTVGASANLLAVPVSAFLGGAPSGFSAVTYNGVTMTPSAILNLNTNYFTNIYTLINPSVGTHNVVITGSGTALASSVQAGSVSFIGGNISNPTGGANFSAVNSVATVSTNVTTQYNNSYLIDCLYDRRPTGVPTQNSGQTSIYINNEGYVGYAIGTSYKSVGINGSYTMGWHSGGSDYMQLLSLEISGDQPASGAPLLMYLTQLT